MLCGRAQTVKQIESIMKKNAKIAKLLSLFNEHTCQVAGLHADMDHEKQTFTLSGKKNPLTTIHSDVNNCNEPYPQ